MDFVCDTNALLQLKYAACGISVTCLGLLLVTAILPKENK